MKAKLKRGLALLLCCACLLLSSSGTLAGSSATPAAEAPSMQEVTLSLGTITKSVIATGSLRFDREEALLLPADLKLRTIDVGVGEAISPGQALASYDTSQLEEALKAAREALAAQDELILQLLGQQKSEQQVKPTLSGVVKELNLDAGQMVQASLGGRPAAVLSLNGLMQVSIKPSQELSLNQSLRVRLGTQTQTGTVARLEDDGSALVTFPDTRALPGDRVELALTNNTPVGEGTAEINLPYPLYTKVNGVVAGVQVRLNAAVTRNSVLYRIVNASPSEEYQQALAERDRLAAEVTKLEQLLASPVFQSDRVGIVSRISAQAGQGLTEGTELLSVYPRQAFVLDVLVDELDILSIQEGQEGFAALDALSGAMLAVKVDRISLLGTSASGITSYTVTLSVQEDSRLLSGMNGTATLTVGEARDAVLVPLGALMSDRNGSYVLRKTAAEPAGERTYVELGISNANFAAVSSGLQEGDVVLMRSAAMTTNQQRQQGFGQMMNPGRNFMPGGGQRR